jgi:hypothetical protein
MFFSSLHPATESSRSTSPHDASAHTNDIQRVSMLTFVPGLLLAASLGANPAEIRACAASTVLSGDAASTAAVGSALRRHGIHGTAAVGCSPLRVAIARCDGGLRVDLTGPRGEMTERVVASADTAALLIESWLRTDIAAPLLAAHALDDPEAAAAAPAPPPPAAADVAAPAPTPRPSEASAAVVQSATPAPPTAGGPLTLALAGDAAVSRDGSRAGGATLAACARVGRLCIGLTARLARVWAVSPVADVSRALEHVSGYGADGFVGAELITRLGRATLRPGVGVGVGWIGTRGAIVEHDANFDAFGPRAEARLALDWPLGHALAVELQLAGGLGASATMDRVSSTRDRPVFVSDVAPAVHGGLGIRYGGGSP